MSAKPAPAYAHVAPAPAAEPLPLHPPRVEIIALTGDDTLLEQIGQTLDGESTIRPADSVDSAREFIRPARPCVLLLDARGHSALGAVVERLQSPDGACIVVVLAPADASASVSNALRGSATFAVLPIPIETGPTMAVLEGAREEALARCALAAPANSRAEVVSAAPATAPSSAPIAVRPAAGPPKHVDRPASASASAPAPAPAPARNPKPIAAGGRKPPAMLAIVATIAFVAVAAAWFTLRGTGADAPRPGSAAAVDTPAGADTPAQATSAAAIPGGSVDELLDKARIALGARHYTAPEGDNALAYLRAVLTQDPANDEAREGMQRIAALLDERLQAEMAQRKFGDAAGTLAQLKLMRPADPALSRLDATLTEAQISAALDAGNPGRASQVLLESSQRGALSATDAARWRDEVERRQGNVRAQQLAQLAATRIRENKLVDPARAAPQVAPAAPAAPDVNSQSDRLAQLVQDRIRDGRLLEPGQDSALAYLNALRNQDPSGGATTASTRALSDALLEHGRSALTSRNFDAAQVHAGAARRLGHNVGDVDALDRAIGAARKAPPTEVKRIRFVPPEYPKDALKSGIHGKVRVRITVAADGKVKSVAVVESSPAVVFDEAALAAVRRWRFKRLSDDNPELEATAMADIVFQPDAVKKP